MFMSKISVRILTIVTKTLLHLTYPMGQDRTNQFPFQRVGILPLPPPEN